MASYARITLIGNLTRDPETRDLGPDRRVCDISLAVNSVRNNQGQQQETVNYYRVSFWNRQADVAQQYLKKGDPVFVEGKLIVRDFTKNDGTPGYSLEVTASDMQLLGRRERTEGEGGSGNGYQQNNGGGNYGGYPNTNPAPRQAAAPAAPAPIRADDGGSDDLPF